MTVLSSGLVTDPGWFQPGWEESFSHVLVLYIGAPRRAAVDERRLTYLPCLFGTQFKTIDEDRPEKKDIDVFLTVVSPPDKNGFCSFGADLWHKRTYAKRARHVVAEVDGHQYRFFGSGYIHVSEIDYAVGRSTIVPRLDEGSMVTIPRHFADMVITEHGVARLAGKDHRERAEALINVTHPDFREELRKEAQKLFYP